MPYILISVLHVGVVRMSSKSEVLINLEKMLSFLFCRSIETEEALPISLLKYKHENMKYLVKILIAFL